MGVFLAGSFIGGGDVFFGRRFQSTGLDYFRVVVLVDKMKLFLDDSCSPEVETIFK